MGMLKKTMVLVCVAILMVASAASAASVRYVYDAAGRLIAAEYDNGKIHDYGYDKAGNLLTKSAGVALAGDVYPDFSVTLEDAVLAMQTALGMHPSMASMRGEIGDDQSIGLSEAIYVLQELSSAR